MSARPGHHSPNRWAQERRNDIPAAITIARILGAETRRDRWRGGSWQPRHERRSRPRRGPRCSDSPPESFHCSAQRRHWRPRLNYDWSWGDDCQDVPSRTRPPWLENRRGSQERPSCGGHQGTPTVPAWIGGRVMASWGKTPRHSPGRPRKVSQGTTDTIRESTSAKCQWEKSGKTSKRQDQPSSQWMRGDMRKEEDRDNSHKQTH